MNAKEALQELRKEIDRIDAGLMPLFLERMEIAGKVAEVKRESNLPIFDPAREEQVVQRLTGEAPEEYRTDVSTLIRTLMTLSKARQRKTILPGSAAELLPPPRKPVTDGIVCAYQGVPGAWSEQALIKMYPAAKRIPVEYFKDVFATVKEGKAHYGIVPIENSRTGAIGETYDLLRQHNCYIVGRVGVDIRQCLVAPAGVTLDDVKQVYSHPEALKQCGHYLHKYRWEQIACRNTAVAAELVASDKDGVSAAISSRRAAEHHGLQVLAPDIMDSTGNRTWFVVIAAEPEYSHDSNVMSVNFTTAHRSGALCEALLPFMACGINLARIESRPSNAGNYRFFVELEGNILDELAVAALRQSAAACEYFEVMGCYNQI